MRLLELKRKMRSLADKDKAKVLQCFFKTGPGEYGEGDRFLGIVMPRLHRLAREYRGLSLGDLGRLIRSPYHEERMAALLILGLQFDKADDKGRRKLYGFYVRNMRFVNNWDLVDMSAGSIAGRYLHDKSRRSLYEWARSGDLWKRRVAVIATERFIKNGQYDDTLRIAGMLLEDREDLIHKAAGWMLREVGKRDRAVEERFLRKHYKRMPRTMLRYAIERFPEKRRRAYLEGKIRR